MTSYLVHNHKRYCNASSNTPPLSNLGLVVALACLRGRRHLGHRRCSGSGISSRVGDATGAHRNGMLSASC
eukprot:4085599-Prymnesium_polylepis.1